MDRPMRGIYIPKLCKIFSFWSHPPPPVHQWVRNPAGVVHQKVEPPAIFHPISATRRACGAKNLKVTICYWHVRAAINKWCPILSLFCER